MRRVKQTHTSIPARRPPRPWWFLPAGFVGFCLASGVLGVSLGHILVDSGFAAAIHDRNMARLRNASTAGGAVVVEVLSEGRRRTSPDRLAEILESAYGKNTLTVDISRIREQLEELPWVHRASVRRLFPSRLQVAMTEHRPRALWRRDDRTVLLAKSGQIIETNDLAEFRHLPVVTGRNVPAHLESLFRLLARERVLGQRVTGAHLLFERRWDLFIDGQTRVRLPADQPARAWSRLARASEGTSLLASGIRSVDLRQSDRVILRLPRNLIEEDGQPT